jgi:hypothetical protein
MFSVIRREDWLISEMVFFAFDVIMIPFFSVERLAQQLEKKRVSPEVKNHFIARCLIWANFFLNKSATSGSDDDTRYPFLVSLNPQENIQLLKIALPRLQEVYYLKGSLE